ncbi:MAG: DUF5320 domain-containing protein [Calditrichaceae bacterium]|nr:DUF5320 domain-containing protein [Calditrichaceae bacterium]
MPRGDRTGPLGEGPMTGRQLGYGAGYDSPGYTKGPGMGMGRGFFGRGRAFFGRGGGGYRFFWNRSDVPAPAEKTAQSYDVDMLRSEVEGLKNSLSAVLDKLNALTSKKNES